MSNQQIRLLRLLFLSSCLVPVASGHAAGVARDVETARRVLAKQNDLPWYDPETDALRPVDVSPRQDDALRRSSWEVVDRPNKTSSSKTNWSLGAWIWWALQALAWLFLAGLLISLLALLIWAFLRMESMASKGTSAKSLEPTEDDEDTDRLEKLPVPVRPSEHDLLETARMYQRAGDHGKAVVYLFAYMLVELDKHQLIRLTKGKTNRQYLIELGSQSSLAPIIRRAMIAFEDVFFGHHPLSRQRFQACWDSLEVFHQQVEQTA